MQDNQKAIASFLSFKVGGFTIASILLAALATLGALPVATYLVSLLITDKLIASTIAVIASAIIVYYLMLAETGSPVLEKHSLAFVSAVLIVIIASYMYIPHFKDILSISANTSVHQVITLLMHR